MGKQRMRWEILTKLIQERNYTLGAEIGVSNGRNMRELLAKNRALTMIGVDHWPADYPMQDGTPRGEEQQREHRHRYRALLRRYEDRLRHIEKPSVEAAKDIEDGSLCFVFIDADHSYEGCKADIEAWSPKVKPGGLISGHDYHHGHLPGVTRAVDEAFQTFDVATDHVWLVTKN